MEQTSRCRAFFYVLSVVALVALVALPAVGVQAAAKKYVNDTYGFSTEFPDNWVSQSQKTAAGSALIFSGPEGTDEFFTTINLQVVIRKATDTLDERANGVEKQFATAPNFKRISRERFTLAGQPAIRLLVTYQQPGGKEMFKQEQVIAERGSFFYMIAYTAQTSLYDRAAAVMKTAIDKFQFRPTP